MSSRLPERGHADYGEPLRWIREIDARDQMLAVTGTTPRAGARAQPRRARVRYAAAEPLKRRVIHFGGANPINSSGADPSAM